MSEEWDMSLELDPIKIINRHVELNVKLIKERNELANKCHRYKEALEKIKKAPTDECGKCNLDGSIAQSALAPEKRPFRT